jgi:thioredoxin reductase (NADPH)
LPISNIVNFFCFKRKVAFLTEQNNNYDILIIGAGPAGLTAAIYSAWLGLKTLVLDTGIAGGKAWLAPKIENFPGFETGIKGSDLIERMTKQAIRFRAEIVTSEEVVGLHLLADQKQAVTRKQTYTASAVIVAIGTQKRKLHVPGEAEFLGRGVSYCAVCDGPFFRRAKVAVIGNTDEAAIEALNLAEIAEKVLLVHDGDLNVGGTLLGRLRSKTNIEILNGKVATIIGTQAVKAIKILEDNTKNEVETQVKGVFIALDSVPMTAIVKNAGITVDRNGCLMVDRQQKTNIDGVFAAGDCTCGGMQVVTAAGEGAMAAMSASAYVRKTEK